MANEVTVRVSAATRSKLHLIRESLQRAYEMGQSDAWWAGVEGPTLGELIEWMCERLRRDRERANISKRRAKEARDVRVNGERYTLACLEGVVRD